MGSLLTAQRLARLQGLLERVIARIKPWSWLWPPVAFGAGLGSFFLVDRQQWLGAALALGLVAAWVLLLSESLIARWLDARGYPTLSRGVTVFFAQMIHQETLFFTLPFVLATTVWNSGQTLFALMVVGMAIVSIIDPLYYRIANHWRSLYYLFHAQCVFLVVLVILPIMLHLTTTESLKIALVVTLLTALPSGWHLLRQPSVLRWSAFLVMTLLLSGAAWLGRIWVPPASVWMTASALSPSLDIQQRTPRGDLALTPEALREQGLYVYTAIRAPRGLSETIEHVWYHQGQRLDRVALNIQGGSEAGYRAWSHKQNFPAHPEGDWRIDIMTEGGQRIGLIRFHVDADPERASTADSRIQPAGLSRFNLRRFIPGASSETNS